MEIREQLLKFSNKKVSYRKQIARQHSPGQTVGLRAYVMGS